MANAEGRAIAAAYIEEAERFEAKDENLWYADWCRRQAALMVGQVESSSSTRAAGGAAE